jgi:hypothetical protein
VLLVPDMGRRSSRQDCWRRESQRHSSIKPKVVKDILSYAMKIPIFRLLDAVLQCTGDDCPGGGLWQWTRFREFIAGSVSVWSLGECSFGMDFQVIERRCFVTEPRIIAGFRVNRCSGAQHAGQRKCKMRGCFHFFYDMSLVDKSLVPLLPSASAACPSNSNYLLGKSNFPGRSKGLDLHHSIRQKQNAIER